MERNMTKKTILRCLLALTPTVLLGCATEPPASALEFGISFDQSVGGEPLDGRILPSALEFGISFDQSVGGEPLDGRILLVLTTREEPEPRFQVTSSIGAAQVFGIDVDGLAPGAEAVIDADVFGFPHESISEVPPGEYYVQAVLHEYSTFHLSNGKTVKLPMDRGEGQHWNRAPGNLYSTPRKLRVDPQRAGSRSTR
jgi:hypothetical protein